MWGLCIGVFISCSKNLSKINKEGFAKSEVDSAALEPLPVIVAKSIAIDTLHYSFDNRRSSFSNIPYFNQRVWEKVNKFYKGNAYQTQWLFDNAPGSLYYAVVDILKNATQYGLMAEDYDVVNIEEHLNSAYKSKATSMTEVIDLDIHISEMYFLFTTHLMEGKVRNVANGKNIWKRQGKEYPLIDVVMLVATDKPDQLYDGVNKLQPANEQYAKLQKALDHYRLLERSSPQTFPTIVINGALKPGARNPAIPLIRKKLSLTELKVYPMAYDSMSGSQDSTRYDQSLVDGVKFFQMRHGLEPDGIIGGKTLKFLNQSFREKADIIALNMERMRWLPETHDENYIMVNVPEYKLRVYENQKQELEMKVIVGASNKPTPIFSDALAHIVFSPTWTVPTSIIKEEIIPQLKSDPEYYTKRNYSFYKNEVEIDPIYETWNSDSINPYQYRIVQNPGPENALGSVKFMMANSMSVYLHDTPNQRLFRKDYRALSHGCVRLDEPAKFAEYLLRDQKGWTSERINKAMNDSVPSTIPLKKRYRVHIEYRTAWVDDAGVINFREDIYGHDKMQLTQLLPTEKAGSTFLGM